MAAPLVIGRPTRIAGRECILIEDEVAETATHEEGVLASPAAERHYPIWVRESNLREMRERHPGVPVYGFWQTVLYNNVVPPSGDLFDFPINDRDGYFLICQDRKAIASGLYVGALATYVQGFGVNPDTAVRLDVHPSALTLPRQPIELPQEVGQRELAAQRRTVVMTGLLVGAVVVGAVFVDLSLGAWARARKATAAELQAQVVIRQAELVNVRGQKNPLTPESRDLQLRSLRNLSQIVSSSDDLAIPETKIDAGAWTAKAARLAPNLSFNVQMKGVPTGGVEFQWSDAPPAGGPS